MSRRTTVKLHEVVDKANRFLATSKQDEQPARKAVRSFVESLLHDADNYQGFRYLRATDVARGDKPGIIFDESPAQAHTYPDETRVAYNPPRS